AEGTERLARSPFLGNLRLLDLTHETNTSEAGMAAGIGVTALADCPGLARLETLRLVSNEVPEAAIIALCRSPHLGQLTELDLSENPAVAGAISALAHSLVFSRLRCL